MLVVDSESSDGTVALARARGARTVVSAFDDFVAQRRLALAQVRTPWALMIDADEMLDSRLCDAILAASHDVDGYILSRTTFYCERPLRMWSGEQLLRLFRTDRVKLEAAPAAGGTSQIHERWVCDGATAQLDGTLLHYSYPTHASYREKYERYTSIEARGVAPSRKAWLKQQMLVPVRFAWYAFARGAVRDGLAGVRVAWWSALYPAVVQWKALRSH